MNLTADLCSGLFLILRKELVTSSWAIARVMAMINLFIRVWTALTVDVPVFLAADAPLLCHAVVCQVNDAAEEAKRSCQGRDHNSGARPSPSGHLEALEVLSLTFDADFAIVHVRISHADSLPVPFSSPLAINLRKEKYDKGYSQ